MSISKIDFSIKDLFSASYRSVSINNLGKVKENGVDVVQNDNVIYCNILEKAMEYNDWPKLISAYKKIGLNRTYIKLPSDNKYPRVAKLVDGNYLWLSRLKDGDLNRGSSYGINYAKWIEEDPFKVLSFVLIVGQNNQQIENVL